MTNMKTSFTHWAFVGPNLWAIISLILIPLTRAGESTSVTSDSCGTYISLKKETHAVHWKGDVLRVDCTIYIQNDAMYENTLCAKAVEYDVKDQGFILTFLSGSSYNEDTKYFTASETKGNISYCARKRYTLALQFSTGTRKSDSHVYLKITQTPFRPSKSLRPNTREHLPQVMYRLMGGIGSAIMVALMASVIVNRRRRSRLGRGGIVIRRAGETDHEQGEEMVAFNPSSRNNPRTFPATGAQTRYKEPSHVYPTQQPIRPPAYSEIQNDQANFKQYPDSAPPRYEDIADSKSQPNTSSM
ncbi:uncharacterized protein LOC132549246 [Ylistrum balloti]|uniref:uncharacterized protein LOC132549246 n=1 Tax=Ylistrum balloti TaxID=509963 RepID=UPI002905E2FC|nr:uncharacterized protein LOC132549246 [Ylistrum balloti]